MVFESLGLLSTKFSEARRAAPEAAERAQPDDHQHAPDPSAAAPRVSPHPRPSECCGSRQGGEGRRPAQEGKGLRAGAWC